MMQIKIYAKGVASPIISREALIDNKIIYYDDRKSGIRFTVIHPITLKVIFDHVYNTHYISGVSQLKSAITTYNVSTNILILTSSGSSLNNNWTTGFKSNDFSFFASNGFKKLTEDSKTMSKPSYVAIKNNNSQDIVEKLDSKIPSIVTLYANKLMPNQSIIEAAIKFFNPEDSHNSKSSSQTSSASTISLTSPTVSAIKVGNKIVHVSFMGITALGISALLIYKIAEEKK